MLKDRNKIDIKSASISHLNLEYIKDHQLLWNSMSEKYEFMDKSINFEESVLFTKELLAKEIENLDKSKSLKIRLR